MSEPYKVSLQLPPAARLTGTSRTNFQEQERKQAGTLARSIEAGPRFFMHRRKVGSASEWEGGRW